MSYYLIIEHKIIATASARLFALPQLPELIIAAAAPEDSTSKALRALFSRPGLNLINIVSLAEKFIAEKGLKGKTPKEISIVTANLLWETLMPHNLEGIGKLVGYIATRANLTFPEMIRLVIYFLQDIQKTNDTAIELLDGTERRSGFFRTFASGLIEGVGILEMDEEPEEMEAIEAEGASPVTNERTAQAFRDHIWVTTSSNSFSLESWLSALSEDILEEPKLTAADLWLRIQAMVSPKSRN